MNFTSLTSPLYRDFLKILNLSFYIYIAAIYKKMTEKRVSLAHEVYLSVFTG